MSSEEPHDPSPVEEPSIAGFLVALCPILAAAGVAIVLTARRRPTAVAPTGESADA
jgi:hypothetical protein